MKKSNIKSPLVFRVGVVLMCVMMLTCHMMSGLYARYTSSAQGSATATVAKLDVQMSGANVNYSFDESDPFDAGLGAVYAVIVNFQVENTGDVAYGYKLNLRLSTASSYEDATIPDVCIKLAAPRNMTQVERITGDNTATTTIVSDLTSGIISRFEVGKAYYAVSENETNYNWYSATVENDGTMLCDTQTLEIGKIHYYQVVYFIQINHETSFKNMNLLYSITCEQTD